MARPPLLFDCWNQNVICLLRGAGGGAWLGVFGKHSLHFPVFGAAWDSAALVSLDTGEACGLIARSLPNLLLLESPGRLEVRLDAEMMRLGPAAATGASRRVRLCVGFKTEPTGPERVFLRRLVPGGAARVPGAVFENRMLRGSADRDSRADLGAGPLELAPGGSWGHLESGRMTLIRARSWAIPYAYVGLLGEVPGRRSFHYEWSLLPWRGGGLGMRLASWIKRRIRKSVMVDAADIGKVSRRSGSPEGLEIGPAGELARLSTTLGDFAFERSLVRGADSSGTLWWGIREGFSHPELEAAP